MRRDDVLIYPAAISWFIGRESGKIRLSVLVIFLFTAWRGTLWSNPMDFSAPRAQLGASDPYGYLMLWSEMGDVDFGNGLVFPLRAEFTSNPSANGLVGYGFYLPLLEAREIQIDDKKIQVSLPDGKTVFFWRTPVDPHRFIMPTSEWNGWLDDDKNFMMWRDDGWTVKYTAGKISQMISDTGRVLIWQYNGTVARGIKEGGKMFLDSTRNAEGILEKITTGNQVYSFAYDKRPRLQVVQGQTLVSGLASSLNKITWQDGSSETFVFGLTEERIPTLLFKDKVENETLYSWNPSTGKILTEGDRKYSISGGGRNGTASISLEDTSGHAESISTDNEKGLTVITQDGIKRVYQVFTVMGPLFGKVRSISEIANGKTKNLLRIAYDEKGQAVRTIREMEDGFRQVTSLTGDGKVLNSSMEETKDSNVIVRLQQEEKALMDSVAAGDPVTDRMEKFTNLANFYLFKEHNIDKAAKVVAQMDKQQSFALRLQLVDYNDALTPSEKIKAYQALYDNDPEHKKHLDFLINVRKNEADGMVAGKVKSAAN